jgi:hypothetical protein
MHLSWQLAKSAFASTTVLVIQACNWRRMKWYCAHVPLYPIVGCKQAPLLCQAGLPLLCSIGVVRISSAPGSFLRFPCWSQVHDLSPTAAQKEITLLKTFPQDTTTASCLSAWQKKPNLGHCFDLSGLVPQKQQMNMSNIQNPSAWFFPKCWHLTDGVEHNFNTNKFPPGSFADCQEVWKLVARKVEKLCPFRWFAILQKTQALSHLQHNAMDLLDSNVLNVNNFIYILFFP